MRMDARVRQIVLLVLLKPGLSLWFSMLNPEGPEKVEKVLNSEK